MENIWNSETKLIKNIAILWLGYVWLPLAYHFDKKWYNVIWFDISEKKLKELKEWFDSTEEIWEQIKEAKIKYTNIAEDLKQADVIIVTVPTPINEYKNPDYTPLIKASETIWKILKRWQIVVYESTVNPWCTEEICLPILEKISWLKCPEDFQIWYSPERINPWDKEHTVDKIKKVVAWIDQDTANILWKMYWSITSWWVHIAPTIMTAESAKVIENTQRDINIALMNELSLIFDKKWIDTRAVLEAASTKWNFLKFYPGLVWWHCIWVDPYYLAQEANKVWIKPKIILAWRETNEYMPIFVANQTIKLLIKAWKQIEWSKIIILWLTFKENVPDFRNSKICDTIKELKEYWVSINWFDPHHEYLTKHDLEELNLKPEELIKEIDWIYDWIIYAQDHNDFSKLDLNSLLNWNWILFDLKWKFRNNWFKYYKSL